VHTWLGALWGHVEPHGRCKGDVTIFHNLVRVVEQVHLAVVLALNEDVRESTVVVVPGELNRSTAKVLLGRFVGPGLC